MVTRIGIFHVAEDPTHVDYLDTQKLDRLRILASFFTEDMAAAILVPFLQMDAPVSLRHLDHLVNLQGRTRGISWKHAFEDGQVSIVSVHESYKSWLRTWKRRLFDCFRRHERVYFQIDGSWHETTPAQLNFFYFCHHHGVIKYAWAHHSEIDTSMRAHNHQHRQNKKNTNAHKTMPDMGDFQMYMDDCRLRF